MDRQDLSRQFLHIRASLRAHGDAPPLDGLQVVAALRMPTFGGLMFPYYNDV